MEKGHYNSRRYNNRSTNMLVEADGRRLPSQPSNWSHGMTDVKRMSTFKNFPHKSLILKLHQSGYFYSGNDDTTICHKCYATVNDWKPTDDPGRLHELNCSYRNKDSQEFQSLGSTSGSLLDEPIEDITGKVPLSPTVITSGSESVPHILGQNSNAVRPGSQIGESWSLQISGQSGSSESSLRLSASAVEVSVESNTSDPVTTSIPHQGRRFDAPAHSHRTVDNCHFPTQVSDADVEMTEDQPTTSAHGQSSNVARPYNIQEEGGTLDPVVISDSDEPVSPVQPDTEWASAFPCNEPEHPNMQNMTDRLETFNGFWTGGIVGNIAEFARAGFYCYDINQTRCFYCGISGHDWSPHEDPWEVHAALRPNCEYLLQQKGPDYISDVFSRRHPDSSPSSFGSPQSPASPLAPATPEQPRLLQYSLTPSSSEDSPLSSMESFESRGQNMPHITILGGNVFHHWDRPGRESQPPKVVDPRQEEAKRKKLLETSLNSEVVLTAMEMGFELPMIKRVIKRKIWRTDETYTSPSMLLDDLLHPPADLDSDSDEDEETNEGATGNATGGPNATPALGIGGSGDSEGRPPVATNLSENMDQKELDEKLREFQQEKRCKVCLDRDADVVFIPCGHLCTCVECAQALRSCPMCRKRIQKSIKTYTS